MLSDVDHTARYTTFPGRTNRFSSKLHKTRPLKQRYIIHGVRAVIT